MRRVVFLFTGALALVVLLAGCDAGALEIRTLALERSWQAWEAAGVPASSLTPARARLAQVWSQRSGPIPFSVISASLVRDPLVQAEAAGQRAHDSAVVAARARAEIALTSLQSIAGANYETTYENEILELVRAREPADLDRLASAWRHQAATLKGQREALATASGGLSGGLPTDVVQESVHLLGLANGLEAAGLSTGS